MNKSYNTKFKEAMGTLCYSWGGDTPPEAVWTANELMELYCEMNMLKFIVTLDESVENYEEFLAQIEQ